MPLLCFSAPVLPSHSRPYAVPAAHFWVCIVSLLVLSLVTVSRISSPFLTVSSTAVAVSDADTGAGVGAGTAGTASAYLLKSAMMYDHCTNATPTAPPPCKDRPTNAPTGTDKRKQPAAPPHPVHSPYPCTASNHTLTVSSSSLRASTFAATASPVLSLLLVSYYVSSSCVRVSVFLYTV
jgi:hypothetical protein